MDGICNANYTNKQTKIEYKYISYRVYKTIQFRITLQKKKNKNGNHQKEEKKHAMARMCLYGTFIFLNVKRKQIVFFF